MIHDIFSPPVASRIFAYPIRSRLRDYRIKERELPVIGGSGARTHTDSGTGHYADYTL